MSNFDQFEELEFSNSDPRCPVAIVLDCSSSMEQVRDGESQTPLQALDAGLDVLVGELHKDPLAKRRVEVSFVAYGQEVAPPTPFATVDNLVLPALQPMGTTSTGKALEVALDALEARKREYKSNGIQYYQPWVLLITDGIATDDTATAARRIRELEEKRGLAFFAVGVEGADMETLSKLTTRGALPLKGMAFDKLFVWLSASQANVSASQPGDKVALPAPTGPDGWAAV